MVGVKAGTRIGIPLAVLALIVTALYDTGRLPSAVQAVEFLIALAGFFFAGWLAGKQTDRARQGALAGVVATLFPSVIILGANVVMAAVAPAQFARAFGWHDMSAGALLAAAVGQSLFGLVGWAICGVALGMFGSWLGRKQHAKQLATLSTPVAR